MATKKKNNKTPNKNAWQAKTKNKSLEQKFEEIVQFALNRGGRIDSDFSEYKNAHSKLWFYDADENKFPQTPGKMMSSRHSWSPYEAGSTYRASRKILKDGNLQITYWSGSVLVYRPDINAIGGYVKVSFEKCNIPLEILHPPKKKLDPNRKIITLTDEQKGFKEGLSFPNSPIRKYSTQQERDDYFKLLKDFFIFNGYELNCKTLPTTATSVVLLRLSDGKELPKTKLTNIIRRGFSEYKNVPPALSNEQKGFIENFPKIKEMDKTDPNYKINVYNILKDFGYIHGYSLESKEYIEGQNKLKWIRISDEKDFFLSLTQLRANGWTDIDNPEYITKNNTNEENIKVLRELCEKRNAALITTIYPGSHGELVIWTQYGDTYYTTPNRLKTGAWYKEETIISEKLVRQVFTYLFGGTFSTTRYIIKRENLPNLELDGYEKFNYNGIEIKLAFEYQGHESHRDKESVMEKDRYKVKYCKDNGIILIVIDELHVRKKFEDDYVFDTVYSEIEKSFNDHNLILDCENKREDFLINWKYIPTQIEKLEEWRKIGDKAGFELLSTEFKTVGHTLQWKLKNSNEQSFNRSPTKISTKGWPNFSNNHVKSQSMTKEQRFQEICDIALERKGKCTSSVEEYITEKSILKFIDFREIPFEKSGESIKNGNWTDYESQYGGARTKTLPNGDIQKILKNGEIIIYGRQPNTKRKIVKEIKFNDN